MPQLSDPLGAPKIITGTEYMDSLARLGYNVENLTSSLPTITKIAEAGTSLLDKAYQQNLDYQRAQSQMALSKAQADHIDSETEYNRQSLNARIKTLDLDAQLKANEARMSNETINGAIAAAKHRNEIAPQLEDTNLATAQITQQEDQLKLNAQTAAMRMAKEAQDDWPQALSDLPQIDDPAYHQKVADALTRHSGVLADPIQGPKLQAELKARDTARSRLPSVIAQQKDMDEAIRLHEANVMDSGTFSQLDRIVNDPVQLHQVVARSHIVEGAQNVNRVLSQFPRDPAEIAKLPPMVQQQLGELQQMSGHMGTILSDENGLDNVVKGSYLKMFDTNGNLNPALKGDLDGLSTYLTERAKQAAGRGGAAMTTLTVRIPDPTDPTKSIFERKDTVPTDQAAQRTLELQQQGYEVTPMAAAGQQPTAQQQQARTNAAADAMTQLALRNPELRDALHRAVRTGKKEDWDQYERRYRAMTRGMQEGGAVSQYGTTDAPSSTDTVPAMLTPGEFVINADAARSIGPAALNRMNQAGIQPLPGSPLQPMPMSNITRGQPASGGKYAAAATSAKEIAAQQDQQPSSGTEGGFFLNPATGNYEPLQSTPKSREPVSASRASGNWTTGIGTEFGEVDNPAYGGYTEPNWNVGKWGDKISGWDTEGVALPNVPRGTIVEIRNPKTGQTITAPVKDHGPGAGTGASIDLLAGTRAKLGLPKNSSYDLQFRIVSGPQMTAGMQAGGTVVDPTAPADTAAPRAQLVSTPAVTTGAVASPEMITGSPLLRAMAYGPDSEGATAADKSQLHGAFVQNLQKGHIAISPDLLGRYPPHSVWDAVDIKGNIVRRGLTVADKSYIDPKNPTRNTVELYNDQDLGHVRLIPAQQYQTGGYVTDPETGMDLSQSNQDILTASMMAGQASAAQAAQVQGFQRGGFAGGTELGGEGGRGGGTELGGGGTELGGSDMMPPTKVRHRRFRPRMPGQQRMMGPDIPDEMQRKLAKLSHDYLSGLSGLIQSKPELGPQLLRHARNQLASNIGTPGEEEQQQPMQMPSGGGGGYSPAQYAMTATMGDQGEEV